MEQDQQFPTQGDNDELTIPTYRTPYTIDLLTMSDEAQLTEYMNAVQSLPRTMYFLMTDQSTARTINEKLAPQFGLSADQTKELTRIVRDVLLSSLYVGDLIMELQNRLQVDAATAQQVANELVAQFFKSAMEDIKAMQVAHFSDRIGKPSGDNVINLRK